VLARVVAFALFSACGGDWQPAREGEALLVVWSSTYGRGDAAPDLRWPRGAELDCASGQGFELEGQCLMGVCWEPDLAWVAAPSSASEDGRFLYERTALAHELWHASLWRDGVLDGDVNHADPGFGTDYGHPRGAVDVARDALAAAGL
jgi:hypothetical protein